MNFERIKSIFEQAMAIDSVEERAAFLETACAGEEALREQVESLLAAQNVVGNFLEAPLVGNDPGDSSEIIGTHIGAYKILEKIGEGGFGMVYMAEQEQPMRRKVALKIIKAGMDTKQVIARFEAERQALALMDHPNIARVLDGGETKAGRPFFVMELVKGVPITEFCGGRQIAIPERLDLFSKVCQAVQHAHQKGIIHRDLKPSNVMITFVDGQPVPKVIDFGVAKAIGQQLTERTLFTRYDQLIGTPAYMSPEQAEFSGQDVDTRSDIYSLGCLLYELLTGTAPIDVETLRKAGFDEIRRLIRETTPPKPSTRLNQRAVTSQVGTVLCAGGPSQRNCPTSTYGLTRPLRKCDIGNLKSEIESDLDWIVMKCLEKERARRYETANSLALEIQRYLKQEPVAARPPSKLYSFQKFARRNKAPFAATSAVLLVLVWSSIVSSLQAVRATRLRAEAEQARAGEMVHRREAQQEAKRAETSELEARHLVYIANMNLVQHAWKQDNITQVRQLIAETAIYPKRGFEWFYWQRELHRELLIIQGHLSAINSAVFSPDSRRILTASWDRTAKVWDSQSGQELLTLKSHTYPVWSAEFSPDGERIVTGSWDETALLWDAATGQVLLTLRGHEDQVVSASFSPDGRRIVTASEDWTARVWDASSGEQLLVFESHRAPLAFVAFSPDGRRVLSGGWDQTAKIWDSATGAVQLDFAIPNSGTISSGTFSPDGNRIVTASHSGIAKVWNAATGQEILSLNHSPGTGISSVTFSQDGRSILTGGNPNAKIWNATTGREQATIKGHSSGIWAVSFSSNNERILTAGWDDTAKVWDAATKTGPARFHGHTNWVRTVAFSHDGRRIASSSLDRTVKVWETSSGKALLSFVPHSLPVRSLAFSPDGQKLLTGSEDHTARLWDVHSGRLLVVLEAHTSWVRSVAFFADGRRLVTAGDDGTAKIWDAANGQVLLTLSGHTGSIRSVSVVPDGTKIATGSMDFSTRVWDAENGTEILRLEDGQDEVTSVAFSPDGRLIVCGSYHPTCNVWDAVSGEKRLTLKGHNDVVWSVSFSADGQRIATAGEDRTTKLWDTATGKEVLTLGQSSTPIWAVALSPDGRHVAASEGSAITLWQAASFEQVTRWQEQERAATEHLAKLKRHEVLAEVNHRASRAVDPGAIKKWLVLLPIPYAETTIPLEQFPKESRHGITLPIGYDGRHATAALKHEQIPNEPRLQPRPGDRVRVGDAEFVWQQVELDDYIIQFDHLSKGKAQRSIGYAVSYIQSESRQTGLRMEIGCDDRAKVYLNGKLLCHHKRPRDYTLGYDVVADVELNAGTNVLLFKVVNEDGPWLGSIRITDSQRNSVKGISVSAIPHE